MRKLSIEEKAARYDEALIRANKMIKDMTNIGGVAKVDDIQYIFPELKESVDEEVRKFIIKIFKDSQRDGISEVIMPEQYDKIFAWLEKQGEKIDAIESFDTEFEKQVSHLIASAINKEYEYNQGFVKWTANDLLNYAKHELKKQGEQKSLDDVAKEVTKNKDASISFLKSTGIMNENGELADEYKIEQGEQNPTDKVEPKFKVGDFVKNVNHHLQPIYKIVGIDKECYICISDDVTLGDNTVKHFTFDNPYLGLVEQNSAWSEEDEKMLNACTELIGNTICANYSEEDGVTTDACRDWLKSIKDRVDNFDNGYKVGFSAAKYNQWKPSDEQMKALREAIIEMGKSISPCNIEEFHEIESLYNDLKKLKS